MLNLLTETVLENGKYVTRANIGEAALYALIGFSVVFLGIAFLVFVVWAIGKIFKVMPQKLQKKGKTESVVTPQPEQDSNELDEQTIAVITAAIAAYYEQQQIPCEFVIKKIKRNSKI